MKMKYVLQKCFALSLGVILSAGTLQPTAIKAATPGVPAVSLTTQVTSGISQSYVIQPSNASHEIDLAKVALRYYYTKSDSKAQQFTCDNAGLSLSVSPYYVDYSKNVTGTFHNDYLEISFSKDYTLNNGKLALGVRFNNSDWSSYENFKEKKLDVIYNGKVIETKSYSTDVEPSKDPVPSTQPSVQPSPKPSTKPSPSPSPSVQPSPSAPASGCVIPKCDVDKNGPFAVTIDKGYGPNGKGWIVRPSNPGTNGMTKHPIFIWNPGGGDQPSLYEGQMKRWASQGFVVYSEESQWSGKQCVDALNWIIEQNENSMCPLYHKLDTSRIAAGGFSLGSVGAYEVASDPRIKTTIHCDGGSFDGSGSGKWRNPTCVMNGLADGGLASNNTNRDYANAKVPIWYGGIIGGGHGSTVWDGGDAITGWLRWQLAGDTSMRDMFLTPYGKFNTGKFKSQWKNW